MSEKNHFVISCPFKLMKNWVFILQNNKKRNSDVEHLSGSEQIFYTSFPLVFAHKR
jgi:hypothetical protein